MSRFVFVYTIFYCFFRKCCLFAVRQTHEFQRKPTTTKIHPNCTVSFWWVTFYTRDTFREKISKRSIPSLFHSSFFRLIVRWFWMFIFSFDKMSSASGQENFVAWLDTDIGKNLKNFAYQRKKKSLTKILAIKTKPEKKSNNLDGWNCSECASINDQTCDWIPYTGICIIQF